MNEIEDYIYPWKPELIEEPSGNEPVDPNSITIEKTHQNSTLIRIWNTKIKTSTNANQHSGVDLQAFYNQLFELIGNKKSLFFLIICLFFRIKFNHSTFFRTRS